MEKLARHPGIRGRPVYTCVSSLRISECSSEMRNFLINRKAFHLYLEPKDLDRNSRKLNMATMAILSIGSNLKGATWNAGIHWNLHWKPLSLGKPCLDEKKRTGYNLFIALGDL